MMKFVNWIWKGSVGSFRVIYFLFALVVISVVFYVFGGYYFLVKGAWGSDLGMALSMAAWVDKYFPHVPFWYPLAGGGVSFTHSYPVFSFYLVAILKRLTGLNLIETFRVLGISSVFLMALGIYSYISLRFKNQTAALLASIFYLISPIAWVWLFDWGFYADSVSYMFVMPAVIFWDLFFTSFLENKKKVRNRVFLVLTVMFVSLAFLTHFVTGLGLFTLFSFYIVGYTIKSKERKKIFVRGVIALFVIAFLTVGTTAFSTFPFYRYTSFVAGGMRTGAYEAFKNSKMVFDHILGFRPLTEEFIAARNITFPFAISILALLGVIISFQKARFLTLGLFAIFALSLPFIPDFLYWVSKNLPPPLLFGVFDKRPNLTLLRFVLPTLAALGAIGIFKVPLFWLKGRIGRFSKGVFATLAGLVLVAFALYKFGDYPNLFNFPFKYGARGIDFRNIWEEPKSFCLLNEDVEEGCFEFKTDGCLQENRCIQDEECLQDFQASGKAQWCHSPLSPYFVPLGVQTWCEHARENEMVTPQLCYPDRLTEKEVRSFWQKCQENKNSSSVCDLMFEPLEEQLSPANWPGFSLSSSPRYKKELETVLDRIASENPQARLDYSVFLGHYGMWSPYYNRDRDLSQIYIYAAGSTLIKDFWAQLNGVFYSNSAFHGGDVDLMNNLAHWFGINYASFDERTDPKVFQEAGWELFDGNWEKGVLKFPYENRLVDFSTKTSILVIGQDSVNAYVQVFRLGTNGLFPYEEAILVWGKEEVDDYELSELKEFDALLLHGYTYENQEKADELLENYVSGGGSVFVDTGWQYTSPDWETEEDAEALKIIPFDKLVWKDLGRTGDYVLEDVEAGDEVDVSKFAPLVYGDGSWSVSTSEKTNLKSWAKVVLSAKGYPLIVKGQIGKGRVIWSGMNILSRIKRGETVNYQELKLMTNLFSWLNEGKGEKKSYSISYKREHPDKVEFTINENVPKPGHIYWKEAYHPDFQAMLGSSQQKLKTYRAGPNFVMIKVPKASAGEKIVYSYQKPLLEKAFSVISILTIVALLTIVFEGVLLKEKSIFLRLTQSIERKLDYLLFKLWKKPFGWWEKEEGQ
jgi:hypothetical protein